MEKDVLEMLSQTDLVASAAAAFSALAAICAVGLTWLTIKRAAVTKRADIHSRFQSEIRAIQQQFSEKVNDPENWSPTDSEKRYIRMYWYVVFDEWVICCKEDKSLATLWRQYYAPGVGSALKNKHFAGNIKELFNGQSALFGYRNEFRDAINAIYSKDNNGRMLIIN